MKKYLLILVVFGASANAWAWDATVDCNLTVTDEEYQSSPKWDRLQELMRKLRSLQHVAGVSLNSETNKVVVRLKDGSSEELDPIPTTKVGLFREHKFGGNISPSNGVVFVKSPRAGEIYISHFCALGDIPFERCKSQGSREQAKNSLVNINVEGQLIHLNTIYGNSKNGFWDFTCSRAAKETD